MITDLLLHPVLVARIIASGGDDSINQTLSMARMDGVRLWLYAGAVDVMLSSAQASSGREVIKGPESSKKLADFARGCQWLAALSGDAEKSLGECDFMGAQLAEAVKRLGEHGRVLTNEAAAPHADACITPEEWRRQRGRLPISFVDLAAQQNRIRPQLERRIHRVLHHGNYIMGPEIKELEQRLAAYVGSRHCITVASGTDSLEIALRSLGIGIGDEVITVPFTWISTAEVISAIGARPVFVDIEPTTFNLDPRRLQSAISPRTKAIIPVSLFGQMADYERISEIAHEHGITVIEDGAQSFGATRHGKRSCGVTPIGSTSFFPAKPLGCYGDGGALFCDEDELAAKMRAIRSHGGETRHHHPYVGMNGRLDTLQAAILLAKLEIWDWEVAERSRIGARYNELIGSAFGTPQVANGNTHVYSQYTIRVPNRDEIVRSLNSKMIPNAIYYPKCLHEQPVFKDLGYSLGHFPEAERASREVLSLPMHPYLSLEDQDRVVSGLMGSLR